MSHPLFGTARDTAGALRHFVSAEAALPVRFRAPGMLVRGFHSDRRWLLPPGASRRTGYIADLPYGRRAHKMNPASVQAVLTDKILFAETLESRGLGAFTPRTLGTAVRGSWSARPGVGAAVRCILKPALGSGGEGIRTFDTVGQAAEFATTDRSRDFLVQELVHQHADEDAFWPGSLNTIRVLAIRTVDGRTVTPAPVQRIGRAGSGAVDNYMVGGLVAAVDVDTGVIGPAQVRLQRPGRRLLTHHPDTRHPVAGQVVPEWPALLELVHRLMSVFPDAVHIGWDMAVSRDGPVVVEGNARFVGLNLHQFDGPFTTDPGVWEFYRSWGLLPARTADVGGGTGPGA